jgi:hypothetical protein
MGMSETNTPSQFFPLPDRFDRFRPILGAVFGIAVLYAGIYFAALYWHTVSTLDFAKSNNIILALVGAAILITVIYVGGRIVLSSVRVTKDVIPERDRRECPNFRV